MNPRSDLERLRNILLGDEQQTLADLEQRLSNRDQRTRDVSAVLADALRLARQGDNEGLSDALYHPVEEAVQKSIRKDPVTFSNLLYPVLLPAIRRSLNETLRAWVERLDRLVSQRFSINALKWRLESLTSGAPYTEIVLRNAIVYSVEQVLLIHNESGLLIQHVHTQHAHATDSDAVSGMLSAIESFVNDSFSGNRADKLNRVRVGERTVYLVHGPSATLACVVRGVPPSSYEVQMEEALEQIHALEPVALRSFDGDASTLESTRPYLHECLHTEYKKDAGLEKRVTWLLRGIALLLVGLLLTMPLWWLLTTVDARRIEALVTDLNGTPGIAVHQFNKADGRWHLRGIADPLAVDPQAILAQHPIRPEKVVLELAPVRSMEESLVIQRAVAQLGIPASVTTGLEEGTLRLSGPVSPEGLLRLGAATRLPDGIEHVDLDHLTFGVEALQRYLEDTLDIPDTVTLRPEADRLMIAGVAHAAWVNGLRQHVQPLPAPLQPDLSALEIVERQRVRDLAHDIEARTLLFSANTRLSEAGEQAMLITIIKVLQMDRMAAEFGYDYRITVIGRSETSGSRDDDQALRQSRAAWVKNSLIRFGVPDHRLIVTERPFTPDQLVDLGAQACRVEFEISLIP